MVRQRNTHLGNLLAFQSSAVNIGYNAAIRRRFSDGFNSRGKKRDILIIVVDGRLAQQVEAEVFV